MPDEESSPLTEDLFGFGKDPSEFEVAPSVECNCGADAPGVAAQGLHVPECNKFGRSATISGNSTERFQWGSGGAARDATLKPSRPVYRRPRKTFKVSRLDPDTGFCTEMKPWEDHENVAALRAELVLAYRILALVVDRVHGVTLDASAFRQMVGNEAMMKELFMTFTRDDSGRAILRMGVDLLSLDKDDLIP